jgi:hypothetical protein
VLLAGAVILVATVTGLAVISDERQAGPSPQGAPANTAKVQQGELSAVVSEQGTLTYRAQSDGSPYLVINQANGIYTQLPVPGQVISEGQDLYQVNARPVVLLYGATPAYRTLAAGAVGADVTELNADLVALGYATAAQLSPVSAAFGSATTTALEKLQASLGTTPNGTLSLGDAVFEPTAVRVTTLSAELGSSTQTSQTVMEATSTTRIVQVALSASQQTDMALGDTVTIALPNNKTTPGVVSSVGAVATCPSTSGPGSGSSSTAPGTDSCSSGSSGSTTPTITVDVTPSDPAATGIWDQAPVQVGITTASVPSALAVPVTALLAQSDGGYVVEVVGALGANRLVPVSLGLFDDADGLVQVSGAGLAAGQNVVVPAT